MYRPARKALDICMPDRDVYFTFPPPPPWGGGGDISLDGKNVIFIKSYLLIWNFFNFSHEKQIYNQKSLKFKNKCLKFSPIYSYISP